MRPLVRARAEWINYFVIIQTNKTISQWEMCLSVHGVPGDNGHHDIPISIRVCSICFGFQCENRMANKKNSITEFRQEYAKSVFVLFFYAKFPNWHQLDGIDNEHHGSPCSSNSSLGENTHTYIYSKWNEQVSCTATCRRIDAEILFHIGVCGAQTRMHTVEKCSSQRPTGHCERVKWNCF